MYSLTQALIDDVRTKTWAEAQGMIDATRAEAREAIDAANAATDRMARMLIHVLRQQNFSPLAISKQVNLPLSKVQAVLAEDAAESRSLSTPP